MTIVLDALDECINIKSFVKELRRLVELTDTKVIATSRKTGDHISILSHNRENGQLDIGEDDLHRDIVSFVRYKVSKNDVLSEPAQKRLKLLAIDTLSNKKNHNGMFLWAYLMCKDLKLQRKVGAIRNLLNQLPAGLTALYTNILQRLNDHPIADRDFVRLVLRWIAGSLRPLRWHELDQALEIDRFRPPVFEDDDEYEEGNLYSRKDIIMICGSLVQYSGLADGDTIGLIHLSTRDFLRSTVSALEGFPSRLECYLVDTYEANLTLAQGCLRMLLSESVQKNEYFSKRDIHDGPSQHLKNRLTDQNPLFDYSVLLWPEYVCGTYSQTDEPQNQLVYDQTTKSSPEIIKLVESMVLSSWSLFWLEEYTRETGTEIAAYTVRRLLSLNNLAVNSETLNWYANAVFTLKAFAETLSHHQQVLHLCFPNYLINDSITSRLHVQEIVQLEQIGDSASPNKGSLLLHPSRKSWIHYDHKTRSVFSTEVTHQTMRVNRRKTEGLSAYRTAVDRGEEGFSGQWKVRSATVNQDATYMAVTFYSHPEALRTVCWNIQEQKKATSVDQWAQVMLVDKTESSIFKVRETFTLASVLQFTEHNQLIAPGGIWDLALGSTVKDLPVFGDPRILSMWSRHRSVTAERLAFEIVIPLNFLIFLIETAANQAHR